MSRACEGDSSLINARASYDFRGCTNFASPFCLGVSRGVSPVSPTLVDEVPALRQIRVPSN